MPYLSHILREAVILKGLFSVNGGNSLIHVLKLFSKLYSELKYLQIESGFIGALLRIFHYFDILSGVILSFL